MNESLKNVFSFMKEALELKNRNVYSVKNYELHIDFGQFYNQFKELLDTPDYLTYDINSENMIFKIKHISDDNKKIIPKVPEQLVKYIIVDNGNDIISLIDDLEEKLNESGLLELYLEYDKTIKEINKYNNLIDSYNSKYMQFYNVYKRINDYEEKIEVIFGQKLLMWTNNQNEKIERYILEANLEINVDSIANVISFTIDRNKFRGFATDFLNLDAYKLKDANSLYAFVKEFNEDMINNEVDFNNAVQKYIKYASLENEIVNREAEVLEELQPFKTYLFDNCGIMVRNKNIKVWIDDLERIIDMSDTTEFQSPILNMFEVDFANENQVADLLNDSTYFETKEEEVLFPLPSNDEQYKIVDKSKSSNIVLVQGPPGTGKSHTIANLISHYIAAGKKVIVTSEKAKALEVLRDKIPEEIRSLSLALLSSKGVDKELEFSIENVLKHQEDEHDSSKTKEIIKSLNEQLKNTQDKKREVLEKIIDLMSKDTVSHKEELNKIIGFENFDNATLMDIAMWLDENKQYKVVPIDDNENYLYSNSKDFFDKLDDISEDIKNNCYAISTAIPINDYLKNNEIELYIKECLGYKNYQLHSNEIINAVKQSSITEDIVNELGNKLDIVSKIYCFFDKKWVKSNVEYEVFIKKNKELLELINEKQKFIMFVEEKLFDYNITYDDDNNRKEYSNILREVINLYDENGNIHLLDKIKLGLYLRKLSGIIYNGISLSERKLSKENFVQIKNITDYYIFVDFIRNRIEQILSIDLFDKYSIPKNQFGKYQDKITDILNALVNFEKHVKEINECFKIVINTNLFAINYLDSDEEFIKNIYNDLKYYITENSASDKSNKLINDIRNYYKDYNLQNLDSLLISIKTNQLDEFIQNKNILLHEINVINRYNDLKNMYSNLTHDKQGLIHKYIYNFTFEEKNFLKTNIDKIFKYHYLEKYYLSLEEKVSDLPSLYEERNKLINEEKKLITSLVSARGWYFQNQRMNYNISTSLNKWLNLKKKVGSGKGKNANIYLRQMREEMSVARNAIPVWIMPVDKLIEQYPFTDEPPFDVLIMDESSQSSVFSISALSRAKKIIIVGDDKQISPTNAFTSIDIINDLRTKYLRNNGWDLQISKDTSIYDIVQTICGNKKITLTEHFRCLPEIIRYSNKEFYNMEINPLKVRDKYNTIINPIRAVYVTGASCKKIGTQIFNQAEIDRIVMLIDEIINDKQYDNKTIGIITLQNNTAKYIQKLNEIIMRKFGEKFIEERKVKIGITYDFQGDERDVIILSMVIANVLDTGEIFNFTALTKQEFDRSFNVAASRAKEQMILVHSVKLDDLSPNCNRYKLLNYCLSYDKEIEKAKEELFESTFEKDVYEFLKKKGYNLTPQFKIGNYRIDFVLTNDNNQKIAIECDGDAYHGIEELDKDLRRQSILERCGWKFARIRASEFYYDQENSTKKLIDTIEGYLKYNNSINFHTSMTKSNDKTIDDLINDELINNQSSMQINNKKKNISINDLLSTLESGIAVEYGLSQFKYMTLFSIGLSRKEIAEYFNVAYDTVKKALQSVCIKYGFSTAEEYITTFKKQYSETKEYNDIINKYNEYKDVEILEDIVETI